MNEYEGESELPGESSQGMLRAEYSEFTGTLDCTGKSGGPWIALLLLMSYKILDLYLLLALYYCLVCFII